VRWVIRILHLKVIRNLFASPPQIIQDLTEMMMERLQAFKAASGSLPERVVIYRAGVSEVCFGIFQTG